MKEAASQVFHYRTFRTMVGGIAILIAIITSFIFASNTVAPSWYHNVPTSISVTYHFGARDLFVGMLFVVGAFLMAYKGHKPNKSKWLTERKIAFCAGLFAFLVALFPTDVKCSYAEYVSFEIDQSVCVLPDEDGEYETSSTARVHGITAILLIASLWYFCRQFHLRALRKLRYLEAEDYADIIIKKVKSRASVYRWCGWVMLLSTVVCFIWNVFGKEHNQAIMVVEVVCLTAFGITWLTAGKQSIFTNRGKGERDREAIDVEEEISIAIELDDEVELAREN